MFLLDVLFSITMLITVLNAGFLVIHGQLIQAGTFLLKGVLIAALEISVIGCFLFGVPVSILMKNYIVTGYLILPRLVGEIISPLFHFLGGK